MRRTYAHLSQGTRPSKKARHLKFLKRYLQIATISNNGLLVVRKPDPFLNHNQLITVPVELLHGLLTAMMHIRLNHPTKHQLTKIFQRYFYALNSDKAIEEVSSQCSQCNSLKKVPK